MGTLKRLKIAVDPGHGGSDPGAVSPISGVHEADVNWDLAMRLTNLIRLSGHESFLTRLEETITPISQRPRLARTNNCDYFVSLHCNSASPSASGLHVYFHGHTWYHRDLALEIGDQIKGLTNWHVEDRSDFGLYPDRGFGVLRGLDHKIPGVLVEYGFLTNQEDLNKIMDPLTRQTTMLAVLTGVLADWIDREFEE
jgi:N-acetylmuramoyl-L-alanine amidase